MGGRAPAAEQGLPTHPALGAWVSAAIAVTCLALIFILPSTIQPPPASVRPSSTAHIQILTPRPGQTFKGDPARIPITLRLTGAHIVTFTSTDLSPDEGHIHLFVDGRLVSMTYGLTQKVWVAPGDHTLLAAFVAVDHAPFNPPVKTSVPFRVTP